MIRSLKAAIWLTALMVLPALVFSSSVLSGLCGLWVTVLAGPGLLMAAGLWGGLAPLLTGLAIFILQPVYPLGWQAAMLAACVPAGPAQTADPPAEIEQPAAESPDSGPDAGGMPGLHGTPDP